MSVSKKQTATLLSSIGLSIIADGLDTLLTPEPLAGSVLVCEIGFTSSGGWDADCTFCLSIKLIGLKP